MTPAGTRLERFLAQILVLQLPIDLLIQVLHRPRRVIVFFSAGSAHAPAIGDESQPQTVSGQLHSRSLAQMHPHATAPQNPEPRRYTCAPAEALGGAGVGQRSLFPQTPPRSCSTPAGLSRMRRQ